MHFLPAFSFYDNVKRMIRFINGECAILYLLAVWWSER